MAGSSERPELLVTLLREAIERSRLKGITAQTLSYVPGSGVLDVDTSLWVPRVLSAKGDVLGFDGTGYVRVPVSTNGEPLIADSATAAGVRFGEMPPAAIDQTGASPGDALVAGATAAALVPQYADVEIILNAGGAVVPQAQVKMDIEIPFAADVVGWHLYADVVTTTRIDLWLDSYANFPPTAADTMPGADANKPQLAAAVAAAGGVAGWSKTQIAAGDILRVHLDTNSAGALLTCAVKLRKR